VTQSTAPVQVVERGVCAIITAKWKAEAVAAGGSGGGSQKAPKLKSSAVGSWPDPVKACSSTTYNFGLMLGPGDTNSCRTWQVRPRSGEAAAFWSKGGYHYEVGELHVAGELAVRFGGALCEVVLSFGHCVHFRPSKDSCQNHCHVLHAWRAPLPSHQ
jgi:hypothetical protein